MYWKNVALISMALLLLINTHELAAKEYKTPYGIFYSPIDAACAHLYQEENKQKLGTIWVDELNKCRMEANVARVNANPPSQFHAQPQYSVPQQGMSPTGNLLYGLGQAILGASQPPPQPPPPAFRSTNCTFTGNTMHCMEY